MSAFSVAEVGTYRKETVSLENCLVLTCIAVTPVTRKGQLEVTDGALGQGFRVLTFDCLQFLKEVRTQQKVHVGVGCR